MKRRIVRWFGPPLPSRYRVARLNTRPGWYTVLDTRTGRRVTETAFLASALRTARELGRDANP